jgi:hypothetical protein
MCLPEFTCHCRIENVEFVVFNDQGNSAYGVILGHDLLEKLGIDIKFSTKQVEWDGVSIPFVPHSKTLSIPLDQDEEDPKSIQVGMENSFMSATLKPSSSNYQWKSDC